MKFFTPDLLERFGSEDNHVADAAQDEWEERVEEYARKLSDIEAELPQRFRELLDRFYLHDARLIPQSSLMGTGLECIEDALRPGTHSSLRGFEGQARCALSHSILLQLDPPPREVLVLQYRSVQIEKAEFHKEIFEECPYFEWQYDEVELIGTGESTEFRHSILFTRGLELQLRFKDFDFATMKPMGIAEGLTAAGR